MESKIIYVYCITANKPDAIDFTKFSDISFLDVNGLFVIMKYVDKDEFVDSDFKIKVLDEAWLDTHVREHLEVIGKVMERHTVIPFNFGTIYKTEDAIKSFVLQYSDQITENIKNIEGKEEWAVKVYCDKRKLLENIHLVSPTITEIDALIQQSSPGKAFLLKKKKIELIKSELEEQYKLYADSIFRQLNVFCDFYLLNTIHSKEITGRDEDMLLNVTFLIRNDKVTDFIKKSDELINEFQQSVVLIDVTGPWPPFSFTKISLKNAG
ncbi:MAG: GvpL/GvpF family gas vesicle protein [Chlorobium sp.]